MGQIGREKVEDLVGSSDNMSMTEEMRAEKIINDVFGDIKNPDSIIFKFLNNYYYSVRSDEWKKLDAILKERIKKELMRG